jgi:hypothetical protein
MSNLFGKKQSTNSSQNTAFNSNSTNNTDSTFNTNANSLTNSQDISGGTLRTVAPDWITNAVQGVTDQVGQLGAADPNLYAPDQNNLSQAAQLGAGGLNATPWNFDGAMDLTSGVAHGAAPQTDAVTASGYIKRYMDPYLNSVVDTTAADLDHQAGLTRASDDLALAGSGAFGGSGAALTKAATEEGLARARASTLAGLRSAGFTQALGAAQQDAGRQQGANDVNAQFRGQGQDRTLTAAKQIADIASQFGGEQRANLATQNSIGQSFQDFLNNRAQAPLNLAAWRNSNLPAILSQFLGRDTTGTNSSTGNTVGSTSGAQNSVGTQTTSGTQNTVGTGTTKSSDPMGAIGQIAQIAALFSDERLKRDIQRVGELEDGLGVYVYRYVWGAARSVGVLAQEVLRLRPDAVIAHPTGYLMVDYGRL